jgi:thymidine kinase
MIFSLLKMNDYGKLTIITGPMWSGKTTELLRLYDRKTRATLKCLLIKHGIDNRYSDSCNQYNYVLTHNADKRSAIIYSNLKELIKSGNIVQYDTIFIDEIQFFEDKTECINILKNRVNVVVAGLNGDWKQVMFPDMHFLFSFASEIKLLTAICGICQKHEACFTCRKDKTGDQIEVGGDDIYVPTCLGCKIKLKL